MNGGVTVGCGELARRLGAEPAVRAVREALAGGREDVWLVGGCPRDALLGRPITDVDLTVAGDPEPVARAVARVAGGPVFRLSEAFGAWRALDGDRRWQCDISPLAPGGLDEDLSRRDFTINAMAVPLAGEALVDPTGGRADLERGVLRVVGPSAYAEDPLRALRLARLCAELPVAPDPETERLTAGFAARVPESSPERVFEELRRLMVAERVLDGLDLAGRLGLVAAVLPELEALHGVEQSHFHHLDVYDHTIEVLRRMLALERELEQVLGESAARLRPVLEEPLADGLTRWGALRLGALLHDIGKPATRGVREDGRVTFIGHDRAGEEMVGALCRRLRTSERLRGFLAALTRRHLVLGFLVHERPLDRRAVYRYLTACEPVEVEVTVLSCADRLATRGQAADAAIEAHLELARSLAAEALAWRADGPPVPPVRGDELADALGVEPGPELGALLVRIREACFTGEVRSREQAVELARSECRRGAGGCDSPPGAERGDGER